LRVPGIQHLAFVLPHVIHFAIVNGNASATKRVCAPYPSANVKSFGVELSRLKPVSTGRYFSRHSGPCLLALLGGQNIFVGFGPTASV